MIDRPNAPLTCSRCESSAFSRPLRSMPNGERLCPHCQRCEYFDDSDIGFCEGAPVAFIEPKPAGQFYPALLCLAHVFAHIENHRFHLGDDWSIVAVSHDAARALGAHA